MWNFSHPFRSMSRVMQAATIGEPCKMVLVVRKDLQMGVGKIAAQCSHAAVGGVDAIRESYSEDNGASSSTSNHLKWLDAWQVTGSAKIVVQVASEEELMKIQKNAIAEGLPAFCVHDAGRTQVATGTATVVSIGPAPKSKVDSITGHLKLL